MSNISTTAAIRNGYYGTVKKDKKTGAWNFTRLGRAIFLEEIQENIENKQVSYLLSFEFFLSKKYVAIRSKNISETTFLQELADAGADVAKRHFNTIVDSIRLQIEKCQDEGPGVVKVYDHLGWIDVQVKNGDEVVGTMPCYRAETLVGGYGKYVGSYKVKPMGSYDKWAQMVRDEVIGNTPLELVLVAGLSAVVNGLISKHTTGESAIFHLFYASSSGKSTAGTLAASTCGEPFDGQKTIFDEHGMAVKKHSVYGSWGATENATITRCAGNYGAVVVLNELGKFTGKDMTRIIYDLSEGSDKARLNQDMQAYYSEGYATTFISIGEMSISDRCKDKLEGLRNRVMEIEEQFTKDAAHADRIKAICRENNGHAAPKLAEYIIDNGGVKMCLDVYEKQRGILRKLLPDSEFKERFIAKFAALIMATAEIASNALGIEFDIQGLLDYFVAYEEKNAAARNVSATSYDVILEACSINRHKFYEKRKAYSITATDATYDKSPIADSWGRISVENYTLGDGRKVIEEVEIYPSVVEKILKDNGFPNKKTCIAEWKKMDVLDYEDTKNLRKRKTNPFSDEKKYVYVFRVFDTPTAQTLPTIPSWVAECEEADYEQMEVIGNEVSHSA